MIISMSVSINPEHKLKTQGVTTELSLGTRPRNLQLKMLGLITCLEGDLDPGNPSGRHKFWR